MVAMHDFYNFTHDVTVQNTKEGPTRIQLDLWLRERGYRFAFDFSVDENYHEGPEIQNMIQEPMSWTYHFDNPRIATLFKLTWGGQ